MGQSQAYRSAHAPDEPGADCAESQDLYASASPPGVSLRVYPYLLRHLSITRPNQVWCADITYIPMQRGFLYLVAIMDWQSRRVLAWRLSNTLDADFCVEALREAIDHYGTPEIFNTDQGCQFTSTEFIEVLEDHGLRISMDAKGRWVDNVFIERLWRALKYECVYLQAFASPRAARTDIDHWMMYYNLERPHSSLEDRTPDEAYRGIKPLAQASIIHEPDSTLPMLPICPKIGGHF